MTNNKMNLEHITLHKNKSGRTTIKSNGWKIICSGGVFLCVQTHPSLVTRREDSLKYAILVTQGKVA